MPFPFITKLSNDRLTVYFLIVLALIVIFPSGLDSSAGGTNGAYSGRFSLIYPALPVDLLVQAPMMNIKIREYRSIKIIIFFNN